MLLLLLCLLLLFLCCCFAFVHVLFRCDVCLIVVVVIVVAEVWPSSNSAGRRGCQPQPAAHSLAGARNSILCNCVNACPARVCVFECVCARVCVHVLLQVKECKASIESTAPNLRCPLQFALRAMIERPAEKEYVFLDFVVNLFCCCRFFVALLLLLLCCSFWYCCHSYVHTSHLLCIDRDLASDLEIVKLLASATNINHQPPQNDYTVRCCYCCCWCCGFVVIVAGCCWLLMSLVYFVCDVTIDY